MAKNDERDWDIYRLYVNYRWSMKAIGEKYGLTPGRVGGIIAKVRKDIPQDTKDAIVSDRVELLRGVLNRVLLDAMDEGDKDSVNSVVKILEREAKYLGLDSPVKAEVKHDVVNYTLEGVDLGKI